MGPSQGVNPIVETTDGQTVGHALADLDGVHQ
jgi:hypothetical protein